MMNYLQSDDIIEVAAPYNVNSGAGCLSGLIFGVAVTAQLSGANVPLKTRGVFAMAKNSAEAWTVGEALYWDNTNMVITATSTGNTKVGVATAVAANPSSVGNVRLNGNF